VRQSTAGLGLRSPLSEHSHPVGTVLGTVAAYTKLVANEPSVGLYFVQEHVRKSVPFVMATKARSKALVCTALVGLHSPPFALRRACSRPASRRSCAGARRCVTAAEARAEQLVSATDAAACCSLKAGR